MASRQEEKEARRQARLEQEERERKAAARNKRLQLVLGGLLAVGIVAAVVVALAASGGDDDGDMAGTSSGNQAQATAELPEPSILDEAEAAKAANCTVEQTPNEGRDHEEREFTADDYETNPPTSGVHFPSWAQDGIYEPGNTPPIGELVHTLEHGRINVQYAPGTSPKLIAQLETFVAENDGYHMLMYENTTGMEEAVAATAWDFVLRCPEPSPEMWDALRTFRDAHIDRGPEKVA